MPKFLVFPVAILSQDVVMEGRTTAEFCCPCTEASAPRGVSFWVELVGLPGFPPILDGRCARCGDRWVACAESTLLGWYGVQRWVPGKGVEFGGHIVARVKSTWELEDLSSERQEELLELTQSITQGPSHG